MHENFPTSMSVTANRRRGLHRRSIGLVAVVIALWSLSATRIGRTAVENEESGLPFLDLRAIATRSALIGDSTT